MTTGLGVDLSTSLLYTQPPRVARSAGAINPARTTRMFMSLPPCSRRDSPAEVWGIFCATASIGDARHGSQHDCVGLEEQAHRHSPGAPTAGGKNYTRVFSQPARAVAMAELPWINPTASPTSRYHPALTATERARCARRGPSWALAPAAEEASMLAIWVKVRVKADQKKRFLEAIEADALGSERDEPGCLQFNVLQDEQDENIYYFYEVYKDMAALEAHRAAPHYAIWRAAADTLDGPTAPTRCKTVFPADRAYWGKM